MTHRFSAKERVIAELLTTCVEATGWALVDASDGSLKRGTVYVTLSRMADKGLVTSRVQDRPVGQSGPARRFYALTPLAVAILQAEQALDALTPELAR